jgi:hypothetical protein
VVVAGHRNPVGDGRSLAGLFVVAGGRRAGRPAVGVDAGGSAATVVETASERGRRRESATDASEKGSPRRTSYRSRFDGRRKISGVDRP